MSRSLTLSLVVVLALCFIVGLMMSRDSFDASATSPLQQTDSLPGALQPRAGDAQAATPKLQDLSERVDALPTYKLRPNLPPDLKIDLDKAFLVDDTYHLELAEGHVAVLTLNPTVQSGLESVFRRYDLPAAGAVAVEPRTGRVLAAVSHGEEGLAFKDASPSASIFKIVTAAALIEDHGFTSQAEVCYRGEPYKKPLLEQVESIRKKGDTCLTLGQAFGESINPVFSSLAYKHLSASTLETWASRFAYGEDIPFQATAAFSKTSLSEDQFTMSQQASGFRGSTLSAFHASLISASVANGGLMMRPNLIETIMDASGNVVYTFKPSPYKTVMTTKSAQELTRMMVYTTTVGSASRYYAAADGLPLSNFTIAGKTGTLSDNQPYVQHSWFSGFAPVEQPRIAVATVLHNPMKWRIKGSYAALVAFQSFVSHHDLLKAPKAMTPTDSNAEAGAEVQDTTHKNARKEKDARASRAEKPRRARREPLDKKNTPASEADPGKSDRVVDRVETENKKPKDDDLKKSTPKRDNTEPPRTLPTTQP